MSGEMDDTVEAYIKPKMSLPQDAHPHIQANDSEKLKD